MAIESGMNFSLGSKEEGLEAAKQAEYAGGNFVKLPGAYAGIVQTACFKKFASGAGGMEVSIKTEEGMTCKVMIITMKKDGTSTYKNSKGDMLPLPGINQIRGALMPVLQQKDLVATENGEEIVYNTVIGKRVGMLVNIRKSLGKTNGVLDPKKVYENADLKTFYCPLTNRCGSEILNGVQTAERKAKIEEGLKYIDETEVEVKGASTSPSTNASDPFGTAGGNAAPADPFADPVSQAAPVAPVSPVVEAVAQVAQVATMAPVAPVVEQVLAQAVQPAPVAPVAQVAPVEPIAPVAQVAPVAVEPVAPVAQVAPVAPVEQPAAQVAPAADNFWS